MEKFLEATSSRKLKTHASDLSTKGSEAVLADHEDVSLADNLKRMELSSSTTVPRHMLGLSTHAYSSETFSTLDDEVGSVFDEVTVSEEDHLPSRGITKEIGNSKFSLFDEETVVTMADPNRPGMMRNVMDSKMSLYDEYTVAEEDEEEDPLSGQFEFPIDEEGEEETIIQTYDDDEEETIIEESDDDEEEILEEETVMEGYEEHEVEDEDEGDSDGSSSFGSGAPEAAEPKDDDEESSPSDDDGDDGGGFTLSFKRGSGGSSGGHHSRMSDITLDQASWAKEMMENDLSDTDGEDYVPSTEEDGYCIKFKEGNFRSSVIHSTISPKRSPKPRVSLNNSKRLPRGISTKGGFLPKPLAIVSEGTAEQESGKAKKREIDVGGPKTELFQFWQKRAREAKLEKGN